METAATTEPSGKKNVLTVYLLRHAEAQPRSPELRDADRRLTSNGKRAVQRVLKAAHKAGVRPQAILTSSLTRAAQTAQIASAALKCPEVIETKHLLPNAAPLQLWREISERKQWNRVVVVGHEPHLSRLVAFLLEASVVIDFKKGGLLRIDAKKGNGPPRGVLKWFVTPRLARGVA